MTTVEEKNVFNIAIDGNFDDCQNIVKQMFSDLEFSKSINMSGVNSINWARIIAQAVYYFYSYFKLGKETISFSVPTGNFGDVFAGYLAKKMGLPIDKLIVATNENDILHRAISKGDYVSKEVKETLSPSMDIQLASNFERLIYYVNNSDSEKTAEIMKKVKQNSYQIEKNNLDIIQKDFLSESCNEQETLDIIKKNYEENNIILDPHTAVGVGAANKLCFNDASQFVQDSSGTVLSIGATDEIDLTATAIDINGTADVSGAFTTGSTIVSTGAITSNAGVVVDNITIDGSEIDNGSGNGLPGVPIKVCIPKANMI